MEAISLVRIIIQGGSPNLPSPSISKRKSGIAWAVPSSLQTIKNMASSRP